MGGHYGMLPIQPRDRFYAMQGAVSGRPQFYFENDPKQIDFFIIKSLFGIVVVYLSHIVFGSLSCNISTHSQKIHTLCQGTRVQYAAFFKDILTITATPSWSGSWMT